MPEGSDLLLALELFRDPILCAVAAGLVLGWLGVFVVLRRMVFVAAAITQTAGLGVALSFYAAIHLGAEVNPVLAAVVTSLAAAAVLSLPTDRLRIGRESLLAVVWLGAAGLSLMVGDRIAQEAHDIAAILFGSAVLVRPIDLWLVVGTGAIVGGLALACHRGLVFAGFDPEGARVQGVPVGALELGLLAGLTLLVAVATRALGALPVFAFSVLPGIAGLLAAPRLALAFPIAALAGATAGGVGYLAAFFLSFPVGASQTAVAAALVLLAIPVRLARGAA